MKYRHILILSALLLVAASCKGWLAPTAVVRFRLTIDLDTPDGPKTGSGVVESRLTELAFGLPQYRDEIRGEAIEINLGSRGSIFLLVTGMGSLSNELYRAFDKSKLIEGGLRHLNRLDQQRFISKWRNPVEVWPIWQGYPAVWFSDRNLPETAKKIQLLDLNDTIGAGFGVLRITIQNTSDPVSTGIGGRLPWLAKINCLKMAIDGATPSGRVDAPDSNKLFCTHFQRNK